MHRIAISIGFAITSLAAAPAFANDPTADDSQTIEDAASAIGAGKFDDAIQKVDVLIDRFESEKQANTDYVCTSGGTDTLEALLRVAHDNAKGTRPPEKSNIHKTMAISQNICNAYFLKGFALIDLKKREAALSNLEIAVALDPDNQHYINEVAEWYKVGKHWQKSLEWFIMASETTDFAVVSSEDKEWSKARLNTMRCRSYRGVAYSNVELERWDKAREALHKCLALIPDEPHSKNELAYIEKQSGS